MYIGIRQNNGNTSHKMCIASLRLFPTEVTFRLGSKNHLNNQVRPIRKEIFQKVNAPNHTAVDCEILVWRNTKIILRIIRRISLWISFEICMNPFGEEFELYWRPMTIFGVINKEYSEQTRCSHDFGQSLIYLYINFTSHSQIFIQLDIWLLRSIYEKGKKKRFLQ